MDIPRIFNISESAHRIHDPFTPEKLATLGAALRLEKGTRVLDLGSGSGEMLCTWARDYGVVGTGVDMSQLFTEQAKLRAAELGVSDRVRFVHGDAAGFVADEQASVAACLGATWIGGGVAGTIELLARSLRPGGIILVGEPYWRRLPPTEDVARGCLAGAISDFLLLPELLASFSRLGYDVVEMVLADQDSWDRYEAAKWLTMRRWLAANPDDELAKEVRAKLTSEPERYATYTREYLGWGVFALIAPPALVMPPLPGVVTRSGLVQAEASRTAKRQRRSNPSELRAAGAVGLPAAHASSPIVTPRIRHSPTSPTDPVPLVYESGSFVSGPSSSPCASSHSLRDACAKPK